MIEAKGREWAQRQKERKEPFTLIVPESEKYRRVSRLPDLAEPSGKTGIKFDPFSGNLFISVWRRQEASGRKRKLTPNYMELPDIETAIRQAGHITDRYASGGKETNQVLMALTQLGGLVAKYVTIPSWGYHLKKEELAELERETMAILANAGLLTANDVDKRRAVQQSIKGCRVDSLGRVNPMIARIHFRSAYLALARRLTVGEKVVAKFSDVKTVLAAEEEISEGAMEAASEELDTFAGISKRGHIAFEGGKVDSGQVGIMEEVLREIVRGFLGIPKVNPYVKPARWVAISLIGCRPQWREVNARLLGLKPEDSLFVAPHAIDYLDKRQFALVREVIAQGCQRLR